MAPEGSAAVGQRGDGWLIWPIVRTGGGQARLYLRRQTASVAGPELLLRSFPPLSKLTKEPPVAPSPNTAPDSDSLQAAADHVLLQVHAPPAVVVNAAGSRYLPVRPLM